jgi:hypothetical protein
LKNKEDNLMRDGDESLERDEEGIFYERDDQREGE